MTKDKPPVAQLFLGDDAFDEFNRRLNRLMQDTSTGETFAMVREGFDLTTKLIDPADLVMGLPAGCEMLLLDGGDMDGDARKLTYHPTQQVCTVVQEQCR